MMNNIHAMLYVVVEHIYPTIANITIELLANFCPLLVRKLNSTYSCNWSGLFRRISQKRGEMTDRSWIDGYCSSSNCKYLHAYICRYQSQCKFAYSGCNFFHFLSKRQENTFLGRRNPNQNHFDQDENVQRRG